MKNILTIVILSLSLVGGTVNAEQTNTVTVTNVVNVTNIVVSPSLASTNNEIGKAYGGYELTLGGSGTSINGKNAFGVDLSLATNPFKKYPQIWPGISQSVYWEPKMSGSTDIFVDWSQNIWRKRLYVNLGWSGGALYGEIEKNPIWRTGPEIALQYYTSGNAFLYAGVNYDVFESNKQSGNVRYNFGIGMSF